MPNNLSSKHILSHPVLVVRLCALFCAVLHCSFVPVDFCKGLDIPLRKDRISCINSLENYCGITLMRVTAKLFMAALWNRAGHYIFVLWFLSSSIYIFSLPNLSSRRLDVYHTSTHGVAVV